MSLALLLTLPLAGCQPPAAPTATPPATATVQVVEPPDLETLDGVFRSQDYDLDRLAAGVPPLIITRFPDDLDHRLPAKTKKRVFLLSLLPMVLLANQAIEAERQEVRDLLERHDRYGLLDREEHRRLGELADYYRVAGDPLGDPLLRETLLSRIDTLPPSLVLAQAATESGWGTSRFARQGNNLFGQLTYVPGNGIVPRDRRSGESHEYKRFDTLFESVRSYMRNLNTHSAYQPLRELRSELRSADRPLSGRHLASGLASYSERSHDYIADLRNIIRSNNLTSFNQAVLRSAPQTNVTFIPSLSDFLFRPAGAADYP